MRKKAPLFLMALAVGAPGALGAEKQRTWLEEVHFHLMRSLRAVGSEMADISRAMHSNLTSLQRGAARSADSLIRDGRRGLRSVGKATTLATRSAMRHTHDTFFTAARVLAPVPLKAPTTKPQAIARKIEAPILDPAFLRSHDILLAWHLRAGDAPFRKSLVRADSVFLENTQDDIYSFDAHSGIVQWIFALPGPSSGDLVADENNLFVVANDIYFEVDRTIGRARQKIVLPFPASNTPAIADQVVILNSWERRLYALNRETRVREWTYTTDANIIGQVVVAPKMVFYGDLEGNVCGITPGQSRPDWTYKTNDSVRVSLTSAGGTLIFPADDCFVHCVSRFRGQFLWKFPVEGEVRRPVWADGDVVYFAAEGDGLYAITRTEGKPLWKCPGAGWPVAVGNQNFYVQATKNELWCVEKKTGKKLWGVSLEPFTYVAPNHATDHIYLTSEYGDIYTLYLRGDHIEKKKPVPPPLKKPPEVPRPRPASPEPEAPTAP